MAVVETAPEKTTQQPQSRMGTCKTETKTVENPLLIAMMAFLVLFPLIAQLFPQQVRDYIGLLFR